MSTQPTPEFAEQFRDFMITCLRHEHGTTAKVLAQLHEGDWRPDPKARTARELAWHIVHSERWFINAIASRNFGAGSKDSAPATCDQIRAFYDEGFENDLARLSTIPAADLLEINDFYGMKMPLYVLFNFAYTHTIHHRAQLSLYLRPLGGIVPDIYGGSADVPYKP